MLPKDLRNIENNGYISYPHFINIHYIFELTFYTFAP